MLPQARALRRNMTPQEAKLWYQFLRNYPVKIYKQRIIESFIVDFYCSKAQLVIEVDGAQHFSEQGQTYDRERSTIFSANTIYKSCVFRMRKWIFILTPSAKRFIKRSNLVYDVSLFHSSSPSGELSPQATERVSAV